jgi:hypothetical protein
MAYKTLVIPTIRENCITNFLEAWSGKGGWGDIIIVEDNPSKTFMIDLKKWGCFVRHYSWEDIEKDLGDVSWIISRRDSAIRSYGFWKAYQMNATHIFTLDDDCWPILDSWDEPDSVSFCDGHIHMMDNIPRWTESIPGLRTRGLPYLNKGKMTNVVANMGFWEHTPDFDAVETIAKYNCQIQGFNVPANVDRIIPSGQYFPLCGMNFAFKREVAVLSYFPLMGINSPYRRFDDIWFGIIFKKICDHLKLAVSVGGPAIRHMRASDPMTNLVKEAPGIALNEKFWEVIDVIDLKGANPFDCMIEVGEGLKEAKENDYFVKLGNAICLWTNLFR